MYFLLQKEKTIKKKSKLMRTHLKNEFSEGEDKPLTH